MRKDLKKKQVPDTVDRKPLQVRLDPELHAKFKAYCALQGITMGEKVIELVKDAMKGGAK